MSITVGPDGVRVCTVHGPIVGANAHPRTSPRTGKPVVPNCQGCRSANGSRPRPGRRRVGVQPVDVYVSWVEEYEGLLSWGLTPNEARVRLGVSNIWIATCYGVVRAQRKLPPRCSHGHFGCDGANHAPPAEGPTQVAKAFSCPWHVGTNAQGRPDRRTGYRRPAADCVGCLAAYSKSRTASNQARQLHYDQVSVDRAIASDPPAIMTRVERQEVVRVLTEQGLPAADIAVRLRIAQRSVVRLRARIRKLSTGTEGT